VNRPAWWLCRRGRYQAEDVGNGPGKQVRRSARRSSGPSVSTPAYERNACKGARAEHSPVATASPSAPCFAGRLKGAVGAASESLGEPLTLMNTPGARGTATAR